MTRKIEIGKNKMERLCSFYVSDYHFEMTVLPYIERTIKGENPIIILTENNLEETIKKVLIKLDKNEEYKQKIYNLGWKNNNLEKLNVLKENEKKTVSVIIKGNNEFINKMNLYIEEKNFFNNKVELINCFSFDENANKIKQIVNKYDGILNIFGKNAN